MVLVPILIGAAIFGGSKNESTMTNKTTTFVVFFCLDVYFR